ncbi:MAG: uroporphyrinogen decarboxylase [candidate division Zixibacteria bacterium]|nr:uroporphyrinogen decarboxylase [candidate division Zixibacteria bacterium]
MELNNSAFIKACYGRNDGTIPIWIMRQAGRYLPEYLEVRKQVSFTELCHSPDLITEVVRQPIARFGLDAAILFSDILTMLDPMGMKFDFPDGGPRIAEPISTPDDVDRLHDFDIGDKLSFVLEGIRKIKQTLPETPLIGFVGSPFTLSCYLIEGKGSKNFDKAKKFLHQYPDAAQKLSDLLSDVIARYLTAQIEAGADAVQVFGSWDGILSHDDFVRWSAAPINRIFDRLQSLKVPRILFVNNVSPYLDIINDMNCEVVGVDYRANLATVIKALDGKSVQGNLDPSVLFGTPQQVVSSAKKILDSVPNHNRLIFNLGHGIQPKTPIESVTALVEAVHAYRG